MTEITFDKVSKIRQLLSTIHPYCARLFGPVVFCVVLTLFLTVSIYFGIEEKTWLTKYWVMLTTSGIGTFIGLGAGLLIGGGIGIVLMGTGIGIPFYAVIASLGLTGTFGGLGLGGLILIIKNPQNYNYDWMIIIPFTLTSILVAYLLSRYLITLAFREKR